MRVVAGIARVGQAGDDDPTPWVPAAQGPAQRGPDILGLGPSASSTTSGSSFRTKGRPRKRSRFRALANDPALATTLRENCQPPAELVFDSEPIRPAEPPRFPALKELLMRVRRRAAQRCPQTRTLPSPAYLAMRATAAIAFESNANLNSSRGCKEHRQVAPVF